MTRITAWAKRFLWEGYVPGIIFLLPWGARVIFSQTVRNGQAVEGLTHALSLLEIGVWIAGLLYVIAHGWQKPPLRPVLRWCLALLVFWWAWCGLSVIWAPSSELFVQTYFRLAAAAVLYALVRVTPRPDRIVQAFLLSAVLQTFVALGQIMVQEVWPSTLLGMASQLPYGPSAVLEYVGGRMLRAYGTFSHPNMLGGFLAVAWVVLLITAGKRRLWIEVGLASVFGIGLALSFSRSAVLAALVGTLVWAVSAAGKGVGWRRAAVQVTVFFLGLGVVFAGSLPFAIGRVSGVARLEQRSLVERVSSFTTGVQLWRVHPYTGVGLGNTVVALAKQGTVSLEPPHAVPLLVLVELGAVGVVLAGGILFMWARNRVRQPKTASLLAVLVILSFLDHYLWTTATGLFLAGFAAALVDKKQDP